MRILKNLKELSKDLKVLYVEDDILIQEKMVRYLEKFFALVVYASDGIEGLQKYKTQKFDIVVTDLSMPKMNGLEMIEEIKKIDDSQAVLITTAHTESDYMFGAIKVGIDGYIIKPFDFDQLNHELFKIAEKIKKFQENEKYKNNLQQMVEEKTSEISNLLSFQSDNYEKTLLSIVEIIEDRDTYTAGHSRRVAEYSKIIATHMGFSDDDCTKLYQAGILHDVGKIATPDAVLLNPKHLNEIEYKLIKEHVSVSFKLLRSIPMFNSLSEIVHSHHERYDGKGYPRGLKEDEIVPLAQIMIVADAFDAMTTNRIYKARKNVMEALNELEDLKFKQFHPKVVDIAVEVLKDVKIDEEINQLPITKLEEERFAYFYKDSISNTYNHNYLDVTLMKNSYTNEFKFMYVFYLKNFAHYNKKYSWSEGDKLLANFANCLYNELENASVFRVFGDDFVVMNKEKIELDNLKIMLDAIVKGNDLEYDVKTIDLTQEKIENILQVENI